MTHIAVQETRPNPKKPYKAYMGGAVAAAMAFLAFWIGDDDPFTKKDVGEALLAAFGAAVPGFGLTFWVRNPRVVR